MKAIKKLLLLLALLPSCAIARQRAIYAEVQGMWPLFNISYDARVASNSHWGYRVGISPVYLTENEQNNYSLEGSLQYHFGSMNHYKKVTGIAFPLEVNFLAGGQKWKFESALGTQLGYYHFKERGFITQDGHTQEQTLHSNEFGYSLYNNIGVRYLSSSHVMARAGVMPVITFSDEFTIHDDFALGVYFSIGYAF